MGLCIFLLSFNFVYAQTGISVGGFGATISNMISNVGLSISNAISSAID